MHETSNADWWDTRVTVALDTSLFVRLSRYCTTSFFFATLLDLIAYLHKIFELCFCVPLFGLISFCVDSFSERFLW